MIEPLPVGRYRKTYDVKDVSCKSTEDLTPVEEIIGQERALRALTFGLNIEEKGFNLYISGVPGTGRKTAVCKFLQELAKSKPKGNDWIYVNNFRDQYEPNAIRLPAGIGKKFRASMADFVAEVQRVIPKVFESEDYANRRQAALREIEQDKAKLFEEINSKANEKGFTIQGSPNGILTIPTKDGKPLSQEEFMALPEEEQQRFQEQREELAVEMRKAFRLMRELDQKENETVEKLTKDVSLDAMSPALKKLKDPYGGIDEINEYLTAVSTDILDNLPLFLTQPGQTPQEQQQSPLMNPFYRQMIFRKYEVNVIVDNSESEGAPVIFEQNASYPNLFGKVEKEVQYGVVTTDFTMIRPGSMHKANGGYMVIPVEDLFRTPYTYDGLKNALKTGKLAIEEPGERMGYIFAKGIKPEPIPLDIKVVLIGTPLANQVLFTQDPDFSELFKVKAEFDTSMDWNAGNAKKYAAFICTMCRNENLKHLDATGIARVVEYGSRLAEDQEKLTTRFARIADIVREASFYATQDKAKYTTGEHVQKAIEEKIHRSNLIQEKIQEFITRDIYLIDTKNSTPGQINGLSVIGLGDIEFGRPSRVTASVSVGRDGIIDIERQAALGGPTHTKGVMILSGYLSDKYARNKPLSLSARLVFEQSYEGVDGDSASSTELYAILSALSGIPIRQSLAVTGSVNQKGIVQAIGGVNQKIEGFFDICKAKGLTGEQGVMIPASNVEHLMLKDEIIQAAKQGKFSIYPVSTIDEGIEVLTGVKAGERRADGTFDKDTVNFLVDKKLTEMAETLREFRGPGA
ncbi:lon-related putative ATP-dependent protease [Methanolinea mesophila]|uniref:Lon protease family protein n=1 Tax=Methanolinea mesophila TaxID=547055 RepID=UPI001AE98FE6|nr:ATP-binding protein [Methanolinea mesophila]MBP1929509.1 lon-related putative ATP-dependent protease [Methanolinea mesophila]